MGTRLVRWTIPSICCPLSIFWVAESHQPCYCGIHPRLFPWSPLPPRSHSLGLHPFDYLRIPQASHNPLLGFCHHQRCEEGKLHAARRWKTPQFLLPPLNRRISCVSCLWRWEPDTISMGSFLAPETLIIGFSAFFKVPNRHCERFPLCTLCNRGPTFRIVIRWIGFPQHHNIVLHEIGGRLVCDPIAIISG